MLGWPIGLLMPWAHPGTPAMSRMPSSAGANVRPMFRFMSVPPVNLSVTNVPETHFPLLPVSYYAAAKRWVPPPSPLPAERPAQGLHTVLAERHLRPAVEGQAVGVAGPGDDAADVLQVDEVGAVGPEEARPLQALGKEPQRPAGEVGPLGRGDAGAPPHPAAVADVPPPAE